MEKYKLQYLQRILKRKGGIHHDMETYISEMDKLKDNAIKCYDDIGELDMSITGNFSEMLSLWLSLLESVVKSFHLENT